MGAMMLFKEYVLRKNVARSYRKIATQLEESTTDWRSHLALPVHVLVDLCEHDYLLADYSSITRHQQYK
jgi:hypothetical protein